MNKILFINILFFICLTSFGQTDTIFSQDTKISCKVLKINTDSIIYRLLETKEKYTISKKDVDKIIYKNGKVFSVKDEFSLKHVDGIANFNDVVISFIPSDTNKCVRITNLETSFNYDQSGEKKYLEKIYSVLKINAAMRGANLVYIPTQAALSKDGLADSTITQLYGYAYSNNIPTIDNFEKKLGDKNDFNATQQWYLLLGKKDVYQFYFNGKFIIDELIENNGFVLINGELKGFPKVTSFKLIAIASKFFTINFEMNGTLYNVRVEF